MAQQQQPHKLTVVYEDEKGGSRAGSLDDGASLHRGVGKSGQH